jgi:aminoglycoside phosphotransferase (APT) family kinase protein
LSGDAAANAVDRPGPVRAGEELPVDRLDAWLRANLVPPPPAAPLAVEQFPGGHSNLTYLLRWGDDDANQVVLRRPPFGASVKTAHDMGREHHVLSHLHPGLPGGLERGAGPGMAAAPAHYAKAPRALAACADAAVIGAPFFLMQRVPGVILRRPHLPAGLDLPAPHLRALSEALVDALVELHAVDFTAAGLGELGAPAGYAARQVSGWTERWQRSRTDPLPDVDAAAAWLAGHLVRQPPAAEREKAALLHNDFKYDNLVLTTPLDGIAAVLDWEMATVGDPLMDLGTSLAYWLDPGDEEALRRLPVGPTALPGNLSRTEVVERYARRSGRDVAGILFYYVFGLFKVAVIAQQIYHRFRSGVTGDPRFAALGDGVRLLGRTASQAIARQRIDRLWD